MKKIYWAYCDNQFQVRAEEPVPIFKNYFKGKDIVEDGLHYVRCPAFKDLFKNTFGIKSLFDYDLHFGDEVTSSTHDQDFYDKMVYVRNAKSKLVSLHFRYILIAEDDSLEMEILPSIMENNSFNATSILIPGVLDVGKYLRAQECAFHCREDNMVIKEDDIYAYIKFNTNDNIKFQRFLWTDEIQNTISDTVAGAKDYNRKKFKPLAWYYKKQQALKTKQRVMKLIKQNLL
jgi:hypothetical protein|tara:strand:+ start:42 stop:737 length:696 start_codon:yes stop_codon:yes gene_type:complete